MVLSISLLVQVNMAAGLEGHRHSDFRFHRPTESGAAVASDTRTEDTAAACEVVKSESRYALLLLTDRGEGWAVGSGGGPRWVPKYAPQ